MNNIHSSAWLALFSSLKKKGISLCFPRTKFPDPKKFVTYQQVDLIFYLDIWIWKIQIQISTHITVGLREEYLLAKWSALESQKKIYADAIANRVSKEEVVNEDSHFWEYAQILILFTTVQFCFLWIVYQQKCSDKV